MKVPTIALIVCLTGCNGIQRIVSGSDQGSRYDETPIISPSVRVEPYAVFAGYDRHQARLFLVHWTGDVLDKTGATEEVIDSLGIMKYLN